MLRRRMELRGLWGPRSFMVDNPPVVKSIERRGHEEETSEMLWGILPPAGVQIGSDRSTLLVAAYIAGWGHKCRRSHVDADQYLDRDGMDSTDAGDYQR